MACALRPRNATPIHTTDIKTRESYHMKVIIPASGIKNSISSMDCICTAGIRVIIASIYDAEIRQQLQDLGYSASDLISLSVGKTAE